MNQTTLNFNIFTPWWRWKHSTCRLFYHCLNTLLPQWSHKLGRHVVLQMIFPKNNLMLALNKVLKDSLSFFLSFQGNSPDTVWHKWFKLIIKSEKSSPSSLLFFLSLKVLKTKRNFCRGMACRIVTTIGSSFCQ